MPIVFTKPSVPALLVYDSFTDVNDTLITNHTPEVGGPWQIAPLFANQPSNTVFVRNNTIVFDQTFMGGVVPSGSPNVDIRVTWNTVNGVTNKNYILLRYRQSTDTVYLALRPSDVLLAKRVGNASTNIASAPYSWVLGDSYNIRVTVDSSSNYTVYVNNVQLFTATDTFQQTYAKHGVARAGDSGLPSFDDFYVYEF